MTVAERYKGVLGWFEREMPQVDTELHYSDPYQLIVAVILSAQCTDKRVNMITPALFEAFPTPQALAQATPEQVYELIRSCSYPNNKTRSLLGMARRLVDVYDGEVPADLESLTSLPGVGRKTANVIRAVIYSQPAMAVDTHVHRVSDRIGLATRCKTPLQTEMALMRHIPEDMIPRAHHWLILHGRYVCKARRPLCGECGLKPWCRYYERQQAKAKAEAEKAAAKPEKKAAAKKAAKPAAKATAKPKKKTANS